MALIRVSYTWKCSCWVEINEPPTQAMIFEQIIDARVGNYEDIDEGPNNVQVLENGNSPNAELVSSAAKVMGG